MSSESGTKHGLNPTFVVFDELAQAKNRELYDVLDTSFGARMDPLFVVISTQSNDPEHILSKLIDDGLHSNDPRIVCHLYEVPDDCENIFDPRVWKKANPALGDFRSLADLKALADKTKRNPAEEPKFRNLYLNQRYSMTATLISRADWFACAADVVFQDGEKVYLGLDLSSTEDLTALVMVSADDGSRVKPFFWKPQDRLLDDSSRDFGSGSVTYKQWHDDEHLLTTPGRSIHHGTIARHIAELHQQYQIEGMAYDRWRIDDLIKEFDAVGLASYRDGDPQNGVRIVPWGQGFKDMTPAIDAFERSILEGQLKHPSNPVLNWNMKNAVAVPDPAGGRKIDKTKTRFRIDGAVALAMALGLKSRDRGALSLITSSDILTVI
jgi:phage terminase large subunit-like protein